MLNTVDLTVFDDIEAFDLPSEFDGEALETETDTKDGSEKIVRDMPDIFNKADVLGNFWRAWTGTDNDGIEVAQEGKEGR